MKKSIILSAALCMVGFAANAQISIGLNLGAQPTYVAEPAPAYVAAPAYPEYYRHREYHHRPESRHDHRRFEHRR